MSVFTSYPGIYIQELASSSHAIVAAPTSIAAFVGYSHPFRTPAANFNTAQQCFSFNDYQTAFGPMFSSGLVDASLPRAVYEFFLNGGSSAWVVGLQAGMFDVKGDLIGARLGMAAGDTMITAATGGGSSSEFVMALNSATTATPTISSLSPAGIAVGAPQFVLTINGSNFLLNATVSFNGATLTPTTATPTQLTVIIPAADIPGAAGPLNVTVSNPGGAPSIAAVFNVAASNPVPIITSLSPASIAALDTPFTLIINGSNFVPASEVQWDGNQIASTAVSFVSGSQLSVVVPAAEILAAQVGSHNITVVNAPGGTSAPSAFAVTSATPAPVPAISSLSPASITAGGAGGANFTLTINGSNFASGAVVNWNGSPLAITPSSATQLVATVPAANVASAGTASITVSNSATAVSAPMVFTINGSFLVPTIASVAAAVLPSSGAGQFTLTVTGANFVPASTISWSNPAIGGTTDTVNLTTTYQSDTLLTAVAPLTDIPASGISYVTVSNPEGPGLVFTALELTDVVPMTVTITNVRSSGTTFDVVVAYGTRVETYRGIQLSPGGPLPDAVINPVSQLIQVAPAPGGYSATVTAQQLSLSLELPATLNSCFSVADFIPPAGIGVFEPNSALDNLEIFNLLLTPGVADFSVISAALAFAERKRAFFIVDPPPQAPAFGASNASPQPIQYWMEGINGPNGPKLPESQNGAIYFPYLISNDPVTGQIIPMAPCGFVAGIYAATDASRGVWKAPAGLATVVLNTTGPVLSGVMNDPQQGVLNLDSINCLRSFAGTGTVVWGARTLVAKNQAYQQSMYVPVRRMTLFIEQTLLANLRWVVFEPNDEPLWIAIVNSISAFMLSLFRQGALQGSTPSEAFQVKCDSSTTSPADQLQGIVNIVVAFAPLKPAEFVIIQIAQLAGQTAGS